MEKHQVRFQFLGYAGEQVSVKIQAITPVGNQTRDLRTQLERDFAGQLAKTEP